MDPFETSYVGAEGPVHFREKHAISRVHRLFPLVAIAMAAMVALAWRTSSGSLNWPLIAFLAIAIPVAALGNLLLGGLRVAVTDRELEIHVGIRRRAIPLAAIVSFSEDTYRLRDFPVGRGHTRFGKHGQAYLGSPLSLGGERGIRMVTADGAHVWLRTDQPAELIGAIERARAQGHAQK